MHGSFIQTTKNILKNTSILDLPTLTTQVVIVGNSVFVMLFLIVFQPFQLHRSSIADLLIVAFLSALYIYFIHSGLLFLFKKYLNVARRKRNREGPQTNSLFEEYSVSICVILLVSIAMFITRTIFAEVPFTLENMFLFIFYGVLLAPILIVITRTVIVIRVLFALTQQKKTGPKNDHPDLAILDVGITKTIPSMITLEGSSPNESLDLSTEHFLFARAQGNYVNITVEHEGKRKNVMIRCTIASLENQLKPIESIVRCHRSYLVNLKMTTNILSINQSKRIELLNSDLLVPLSRAYYSHIKEMLLIKFD